jgi:hypothetical protein
MDLCCGLGGWAEAFGAAGWIVYGVDIHNFGRYPGIFIRSDIRLMRGRDYRGGIDLVVASPPCTEFSKYDSPGLFPNMERPSVELVNSCFQFAADAQVPIVLENVRGLQKLIGQAVQHYGSFYLWGDVPPLKPYIPGRAGRPVLKWNHRSPSLRAKIPFELAYIVSQFHTRVLEDRRRIACQAVNIGMSGQSVSQYLHGSALSGSCHEVHAEPSSVPPREFV